MDTEVRSEMVNEPAVVPMVLNPTPPAPPSKAGSIATSKSQQDEKKYETIQTIKLNDPSANNNSNLKSMDKPSVINSSLNLLPNQLQMPKSKKTIPVNTKLGIIQLILSVLLSAFGGLLIARNASLGMLGSGIWSGIFAGIAGALGLMNIKPLLNGFLAVSLISVATSTLALALTGIGLIRDYNLSQQDVEIESAVLAACGLTFFLVLHLFTSIFSVYFSALRLCSNKQVYDQNFDVNAMNYQKVQNYLKSLQNSTPGSYYIGKDQISNEMIQGYQNYINQTKLYRQHSMAQYGMHGMLPIYAPASNSSAGYMTCPRMYSNTLPHSNHNNHHQQHQQQQQYQQQQQQYQQQYHHHHQDERSARTIDSRRESRREKIRKIEKESPDINLSYTGLDREIADSFLKQQEAKEILK